jgi:hypothetical protein
MGNCCRNKNYIEPEIEKCQNINDLKNVVENKKNSLIKERENYQINNFESERSDKLFLDNINTSINKSVEQYDRLVNLLMKYEKKIKNMFKIKKLVNNICNFGQEKDYASMKYIIDDIENYCITHY